MDPEEAIPVSLGRRESPRADAATREKGPHPSRVWAQLNAHLFSDARATTEKLARVARDRDLREQAEIFLGQISLAEGDSAGARRSWEAFLEKHPDSPRRQEAETRIAALSSATVKGKS